MPRIDTVTRRRRLPRRREPYYQTISTGRSLGCGSNGAKGAW